jgi:pimeloyl-ACP methyl ester carboxylesterase
MPGHGRSDPLSTANLESLSTGVYEALVDQLKGRSALLVGESLGGLVALRIAGMQDPGPVRAIIAMDPPLTTAKLWHVAQSFRGEIQRNPASPLATDLGRDIFGFWPGRFRDHIYYPLIGELRLPAAIAVGDIPIFPPRDLQGIPCLIDAVDRFVIEQFYPDKVQLHQFTGYGHLLLRDALVECQALIQATLAEHFQTDTALQPTSL